MSVEGPERFTGGCLCGSVRIVASGRPYRVGVCHCLDCRKHHGALFHASAIFPQDAVTMLLSGSTAAPTLGPGSIGPPSRKILDARSIEICERCGANAASA
jgi:hypothetical protein